MKTKIFLTVGCITLLGSTAIRAQWKVIGNNVTQAVGTFGTLNNKTIEFISNGVKQGTLTNDGKWGFGTNSPSAKVHINSASGQVPLYVMVNGSTKFYVTAEGGVRIGSAFTLSTPANGLHVVGNTGIGNSIPEGNLHVFRGSAGIVTAYANAPLIVENSTNNYINLLAPSANERGILFGDNLDATDGGIIYGNVNLPDGMQFRTNGNVTRMSLTSAGNLGVGTPSPEANLHVFRGSAGIVTANANAPFIVENSANNYINLLTPSGNERGILFGDNLNPQDGGIVYVGSDNSMQFRTNGNITRMTLSDGTGFFALSLTGNARATGVWFDSDLKLKKDISDFNSVMDVIKQLKPKTYFFKKEEYKNLNLPSSKQHGFVAQELEKVLPELVQSSQQSVRTKANGEPEMEDVKSVNYIGLIPILTKALQEQQQQIDELKQIVNQFSLSKAQSENNTSAKTTNTAISNALEQNIPNPFNHTTTINYTLPKQFANAQILITDQNGNVLKRTNLSGRGKGTLNIDASAFSSGAYTYSLVVDGHLIDTKKMILAK